MAWYYGVNNSELYGSNFSTVLADAPPPLDDTYEEDENEIVFRNDGKKSKKYSEDTDASSMKKSHSSDEKFNDKSKYDGTLPNGENQPEVEEDSDFGDFAGFADFGSAFGQENSGETQDWFASNENNSLPAVKAANSPQYDDEEYADFAAFHDSLNHESIPNGGSDQANSNASDFYNYNKNGLGNRTISSNGSYDKESDDEFGDFAENSPKNDSKNIKIQPDTESTSVSQGRTCSESNTESNSVDADNTRNIVHCNGDLADKKSVSHLGESTINHASECAPNVNKGSEDSPRKVSMSEQENEFGTKRDTNNANNSSSAVIRDEESRPLDNLSVTCEDYQPSDSSVAVPEIEEDQIKNNGEGDRTDTFLSSNNGKEKSESTIKSNETNCTKSDISDSSTCEHGSEAKILPENNELNDDGFGEFADFTVKQPSIDNDDGEKEIHKEIPDSPGMSAPIGGEGDEHASCTEAASVQDKDDDDDFEDFGSFGEKHDQNNESTTDFVATDSEAKCLSNENDDGDDDFGDFGTSNPEQKTLPTEDQNNDDFGDFGTFDSSAKDSQKDDDDDDFGDFGTSNPEQKTLPNEDQNSDDFGDFGTFDSSVKNSQKDDDNDDDFGEFGTSNSEQKTLPIEDQDSDDQDSDNNDDFGDFGTSNSEQKTLPTEDQSNDDFGDFGTFDSSVKHSNEDDDSTDDFGDFGTFNSSARDSGKDDINDDSFGHFGAFDAQANDSLEKNESDNEFGDFGTVEPKVKDVTKADQRNSSNVKDFNAVESKDDNKFGDFRTSVSPQNNQMKKQLQNDEFGAFNSPSKNLNNSRETDDDFSGGNEGKASSVASFSASHSSVSSESSPRKKIDLQQKGTETLYFVPGGNVIIKQAGDPISLCFTLTELRHMSDCRCDVLSSRVEKSLQSNLGVWQQLERTDKEGRILFHWSNSFSQHKKFLSLTIRPDRPPPLQGGSMLKPMVSSQFVPFGGGLAGSMLMPEPPGKLHVPHFSSKLAFLEPVKGSQIQVQSTAQEKIGSHHSIHPEIGLPDLSFVLGNGLKRTASKSDIKDNVSDTASESSSLDLDFFAPGTTQPSNGKPESRGLYEEDLLGLNIFSGSSSLEPPKLESPKLQKTSDTKKVWQHGGVTIPLSSQESRAQLSDAAKRILHELEDLRFMRSSVLMFPLKPE